VLGTLLLDRRKASPDVPPLEFPAVPVIVSEPIPVTCTAAPLSSRIPSSKVPADAVATPVITTLPSTEEISVASPSLPHKHSPPVPKPPCRPAAPPIAVDFSFAPLCTHTP